MLGGQTGGFVSSVSSMYRLLKTRRNADFRLCVMGIDSCSVESNPFASQKRVKQEQHTVKQEQLVTWRGQLHATHFLVSKLVTLEKKHESPEDPEKALI